MSKRRRVKEKTGDTHGALQAAKCYKCDFPAGPNSDPNARPECAFHYCEPSVRVCKDVR